MVYADTTTGNIKLFHPADNFHKSHYLTQSETDSTVNSKAVSPFNFQQELDTPESRIDQGPHLIEEVFGKWKKILSDSCVQ